MKKAILFNLIFILIPVLALAHGEMQIVPQSSTSLKITYDDKDYFENSDNLEVYSYVFYKGSELPKLIVTDLKQRKRKSKANITLPEPADYIIAKVVSDKGKVDNNYNDYFVFTPKADNPYKNYFLKLALFYMGSLPEQCRMDLDYSLAEKYFRLELKNFPDNIQAEIGLTSLLFDIKRIGQQEYNQNLENILKKNFDTNDEATVKSVSRAFKIINQAQAAEKLEQIYISKYPQSDLAEEKVLMKLANAQSRDEFVSIARQFFSDFPNSKSKTKIYNALVSAFMQNGKYEELKQFMTSRTQVPPMIYLSIANRLIEDSESYDGANLNVRIKEARQLLKSNRELILNSLDLPDFLAKDEVENANRNLNVMFNFAMAKSFLAEEKYSNAIEYFSKVWNKAEVFDQKFYELYAFSLFELDRMNEGLEVLESAAMNTVLSNDLEDIFQKKYTEIKSVDETAFAKYLESILKENKAKRTKNLSNEELNRDVNTGTLQTLDEKYIDLSDMKGSVVVALLWSSWCGPCQTMFPVYNDLYNQYEGSNDIVFLSLNIWERKDQDSDINTFLNEAEVDFPVLIDEAAFTPKNAGINGLPMTLIFGKDGKLKFKIRGFAGDKKYMADVLDRVEYLLK